MCADPLTLGDAECMMKSNIWIHKQKLIDEEETQYEHAKTVLIIPTCNWHKG